MFYLHKKISISLLALTNVDVTQRPHIFMFMSLIIVNGLHRERRSPPSYTLNLYKIFINTLNLRTSNSCCVTPVGCNLSPDRPNFLLHALHYICYPILNFKTFSYIKTHCLQVLLNKYFS